MTGLRGSQIQMMIEFWAGPNTNVASVREACAPHPRTKILEKCAK